MRPLVAMLLIALLVIQQGLSAVNSGCPGSGSRCMPTPQFGEQACAGCCSDSFISCESDLLGSLPQSQPMPCPGCEFSEDEAFDFIAITSLSHVPAASPSQRLMMILPAPQRNLPAERANLSPFFMPPSDLSRLFGVCLM